MQDDPLLGQMLGAYRVDALIGEGGMGKVYRAEQASLGRMVCLKTLLPGLSNDVSVVRRFEQEARAASALHHPNIVSVLDFGRSEDGILYIVGGGGGSTLGGLTPEAPDWSARRLNRLHHLRVHVQADRIDGYAICGPEGAKHTDDCEPGAVIDTWSIVTRASGAKSSLIPDDCLH